MNVRSALAWSAGAAGPLIEGEPGESSWQDDSACATVDPELFFPEPGGHDGELAKTVCASCPVVRECLEYAMARNEHWGIWGGLSELERRRLRRRRSRATLREAA